MPIYFRHSGRHSYNSRGGQNNPTATSTNRKNEAQSFDPNDTTSFPSLIAKDAQVGCVLEPVLAIKGFRRQLALGYYMYNQKKFFSVGKF